MTQQPTHQPGDPRLTPQPKHALPGPDDITRVALPNGITVLSRPNFNSPSVVISGFLKAGSLSDPLDKLGLADFTAEALMRGTEQRDFRRIFDDLESAGARLGIGGGTHITRFSGKCLAEDLEDLLGLLAEVLRCPVFPEQQVERLRALLLTGLAVRAQDTGEMASMAFDEVVYAHHPYSRPNDGYPETIQAITRDDLIEFHRRHFRPRGMVIVVVGAVVPMAAVDHVRRALGDWQNPEEAEAAELPPVRPLEGIARKDFKIPGKAQSDLVLGVAALPRRDPAYPAAALGNNIFGQFGMMGRIGEAVREKAGLAYYAHSSLSAGYGPGPWYVSAGVDPANLEQAIELIIREIDRFTSEPVSAEELSDSQANFIGRLPLSMETNSGVAGALVNLERYELGLDYYQRYPEMIRSVTPEQILETARRFLHPERLGIGTAGP